MEVIMENLNSFTDIAFFVCIFISIAVGWFIGYAKGVVSGYNHAAEEESIEYPILNVYFYESSEEEKYTFNEMISGDFIMLGSIEECIKKLKSEFPEKKIVFSRGDKNE
jgi:hypothetical protein